MQHRSARPRDAVYHSAFRYGSRWRWAAAISFVVERATATALLLAADPQHPGDYLGGGFLAADAAVTAALLFAPRKEVYRKDEVAMTTHVRSDCPDGLALEIAGDSFPVDAAGRLGELGDTALGEWMAAPHGELRARLGEQISAFPIGPIQECQWRRTHGRDASCAVGMIPPAATVASFDVSVGSLAAAR